MPHFLLSHSSISATDLRYEGLKIRMTSSELLDVDLVRRQQKSMVEDFNVQANKTFASTQN